MRPSEVSDSYFYNVRTRNIDGLMALFADDAILTKTNDSELMGVAAIREMYLAIFASSTPPSPNPIGSIAGAHSIATEIEVRLPDGGKIKSANFFHLNDAGLIQRLGSYKRT